MGRISSKKKRKSNDEKKKIWMQILLPKVQHMPLQSLTMDDLAKLIGKSKSTVYEYFKTKEELFHLMAQTIIEALDVVLEAINNKADEVKSQYLEVMQVLGSGLAGISLSFLKDLKSYYPLAWQEVDLFINKVLNLIATIYEKGMNNNTFKRFSIPLLKALDKNFVLLTISDSTIFESEEITIDEVIQQYLELRLNGVLMKKLA